MKKVFLSLSLLIVSAFCFAGGRKVTFDLGVSTGIPFYGNSYVKDITSSMSDGNKFVIGATTDINFCIIEPVTLFLGVDILNDHMSFHVDENWNSANYLDYAFFGGMKIYPGLWGLNFSLAYAVGNRFDLYKLNGEKKTSSCYWGNGMRLGVEYNFAHMEFHRFLPSAGIVWRWLPRGNNESDNIISAYVLLNF